MEESIKRSIQDSFNRQGLMKHLGVEISTLEDGYVELTCMAERTHTQQNGFLHAGVLTTMMDVACGYAAKTKMKLEEEVLSVEFKSTFLRPAKAQKVVAGGKVIRAGKKLVFCEGLVWDHETRKEFCRMTATMIRHVEKPS